MSDPEPPTFRLGITMAGAISAGAYSGGVFDMIFEVLDAWEAQKEAERHLPPSERTVPWHDVIIPAISGASAGSITGAMGLVSLATTPPTARSAPASTIPTGVKAVQVRLSRLYSAWVIRPRFADARPAAYLLGQEDLKEGVFSALDTTLLDRIASDALAGIATTYRRKYLPERLHLFLTVTNLQGTPHGIDFSGEGTTERYVMTCHADRVHFAISGLGCAKVQSAWAEPDPAREIDVRQLENHPAPHKTEEWSAFLGSTLASSAFPVGLSARQLPPVQPEEIGKRQWPIRSDRQGADRFRLPSPWTKL